MRRLAILLLWISALAGLTLVARAAHLAEEPVLSLHGNTATFHWKTRVPTGTRLQITPDATVRLRSDEASTTDHLVAITGLRPGVEYTLKFGTARFWLGTRSFELGLKGVATMLAAPGPPNPGAASPPARSPGALAASETWANMASLPDHFARHGANFRAKDAEEYARLAWELLQRAKRGGLPAKVDGAGVIRVFETSSGSFAAYNRDGTTKTFFKPGSPGYFERQPGQSVDLRTWR